jgi:transposase
MGKMLTKHHGTLLGLGDEWQISDVELDVAARRLDIWLEYNVQSAICPECGMPISFHDQQPERVWWHLDTIQFETLLHVRTPCVSYESHKVKIVELTWAAKNSRFTLLFETFAVDVFLSTQSIQDARKLLRLSWYQVMES